MRRYMWPARGRPIRLLLLAWWLSYAGDLAAFTAASVYVYHAGGAAYVGLLGLLIAMSRLQARTLAREEFLGAVTGNAASAEGADDVFSARLRAG